MKPRLLDLYARECDRLLHAVVLDHAAAEGLALAGACNHQLDQHLCAADQPHAVMDARRAEPRLRRRKAAALRTDQVIQRHFRVREFEFPDGRDVIFPANEP